MSLSLKTAKITNFKFCKVHLPNSSKPKLLRKNSGKNVKTIIQKESGASWSSGLTRYHYDKAMQEVGGSNLGSSSFFKVDAMRYKIPNETTREDNEERATAR